MKYRVLLTILFLSLIIKAQQSDTSSHDLEWKGIERWDVGRFSIDVVNFEGASYPFEDKLPYFEKRIPCANNDQFTAKVINEKYIDLTKAEIELLNGKPIPNELNVKIDYLQESTRSYANFTILPFVLKDSKILKLKSFVLQISKSDKPRKTTSITPASYANNSVLAQGRFVKIKITDSGIYKLTYEDLANMGIDPTNVRVFGYGGAVLEQNFSLPKIDDLPEVAIWMEKGSDNIFNAGDYILFYGQGVNRWIYDDSLLTYTHTLNPYSKYGYYFVSSDAGIGKKIQTASAINPDPTKIVSINQFTDYKVFEKETTNILSSGKVFYGELFNDILSYTFSPKFTNIVPNSTTTARLDVIAAAGSSSTTVLDNSFTLSSNGTSRKAVLGFLNPNNNKVVATNTTRIFAYNPQNDNFEFTLTYSKPTPTSYGYLNYLEINTKRYLKMVGAAMPFQNVDNLNKNLFNNYKLSEAGNNVQIWDITDPINITQMTTTRTDNEVSFVASSNTEKRYIATDPTAAASFSTPEIVGEVTNQNLHSIPQADMVIITHPNFISQAEQLANAHRTKDNLTVAVATTEQVYNEFSSGTPDATAYRWFSKMLYDRANGVTANMPKYLLLFGRGTFDNRKLLSTSGDNLVLTYQSENSLDELGTYVTDDYFGLLNDNEGTNIPAHLLEMGVGRFPVSTVQQATDVVNKTINYMNNTVRNIWKNQLCFLADDGDKDLHGRQADSVASYLNNNIKFFQINKIYLDSYTQETSGGKETYPIAKTKLTNLLQTGLFMLNYTGHASANGWATEGFMLRDEVKALTNKNLPIWVAAGCDYSQFDGASVSAGEHVVLNPNGGGIGILASARLALSGNNLDLNFKFCKNLFLNQNDQNLRVGDALLRAKNLVGNDGVNRLNYLYLGDPAVRLTYPTQYQVLTQKVNNKTIEQADTLKALSVGTVSGIIADKDGNVATNFNGKININVYDKVQAIKTLNNDKEVLTTDHLAFYDRPDILFSGVANVTNGEYSLTFILPKDIKYNYGMGRINYYAEDEVTGAEAQGYFENFIIGGVNKNYTPESQGPSVNMYLGNRNFKSGDKVNENPTFVAEVSDISGINTIGTGIGHNIMLIVDEDQNQTYVLNDNYLAQSNNYTQGTVRFNMPTMTVGKHTLTFRIWDLQNNSTTATANFEVVKGFENQELSISNYPNPVSTSTKIIVNYNNLESITSGTFEIFDVSGRLIYSITKTSLENTEWNLTDNTGQKVKSGVYFYRINIKTKDCKYTSKTNKMVIIRQ